jgi:hypothetical protein
VAIATQSLPMCIYTACLNLRYSSDVHVPARPGVRSMMGSKTSCHLLQHCFCVRPGIISGVASQFLRPCLCATSFSFMPSSAVQRFGRPLARSSLGSKARCRRLQHCILVRSETSATTVAQSVMSSLPRFFLQVITTALVSFESSSRDQRPATRLLLTGSEY